MEVGLVGKLRQTKGKDLMPGGKSGQGTVAAAYLAALGDRGIKYIFANSGTDFAPIIEASVASSETNRNLPRLITVPHENVAVAMAHGYYRMTGSPAVVMVHVTVGTANALCGLMNAARDNVPLLLAAGRTPHTELGDAGSRALPIHWAQDNFDHDGRPHPGFRTGLAWVANAQHSLVARDVRPGGHAARLHEMGLRTALGSISR